MSWLCSCGLVNSGANKECAGIRARSAVADAHKQVSENNADWVMSYLASKELNMTEQEELFTHYYNHEKILVKDMDIIQMREHRKDLAKIALEAKARVVAADDELRERSAKQNNKEWLTTDTRPTYDVSSAINVVKQRGARMTKMDKLREDLAKTIKDPAALNEIISNLEKRATDAKLKTVTFKAPATKIKSIEVKREPDGGVKKPFDPDTLFGK